MRGDIMLEPTRSFNCPFMYFHLAWYLEQRKKSSLNKKAESLISYSEPVGKKTLSIYHVYLLPRWKGVAKGNNRTCEDCYSDILNNWLTSKVRLLSFDEIVADDYNFHSYRSSKKSRNRFFKTSTQWVGVSEKIAPHTRFLLVWLQHFRIIANS